MTEREQFEKVFPVPSETVWSDHLSAYVQKNRRVLSAYDDLWQVWQAARATPALPYQPDEIPRLVECLKKANENAEHFERHYYLLCDKVEELESRTPALPKDDSASPDGYAEGWSAARRAMLNGAFETKVPQIPEGMAIVPVELLKEAVGQLSELNTFAAIRAIIEDKP
jgi:hypothetical protein